MLVWKQTFLKNETLDTTLLLQGEGKPANGIPAIHTMKLKSLRAEPEKVKGKKVV